VIRFMQRFRLLSVLVVIPLMLVGCGVNDIPTKQVKAQAAWGDVQSQYQRRADLVPNLVATVQGYAFQEKTVLLQVTQARASARSASMLRQSPIRQLFACDIEVRAHSGGALSCQRRTLQRTTRHSHRKLRVLLQFYSEGVDDLSGYAARGLTEVGWNESPSSSPNHYTCVRWCVFSGAKNY
jgi:hypothetical protein